MRLALIIVATEVLPLLVLVCMEWVIARHHLEVEIRVLQFIDCIVQWF